MDLVYTPGRTAAHRTPLVGVLVANNEAGAGDFVLGIASSAHLFTDMFNEVFIGRLFQS